MHDDAIRPLHRDLAARVARGHDRRLDAERRERAGELPDDDVVAGHDAVRGDGLDDPEDAHGRALWGAWCAVKVTRLGPVNLIVSQVIPAARGELQRPPGAQR